jgi:Cu2+-exporting ATPase
VQRDLVASPDRGDEAFEVTPATADTDTLTFAACAHCGTLLGAGAVDVFCCAGCARVHSLLHAGGLARYYDLRGGGGVPVGPSAEAPERAWLAPLRAQIEASENLTRVAVDVGGVHCAACVWLIGELFRRAPRGRACVVNASRGRIELTVERGFDLDAWVSEVEAVGYALGPALKERSRSADALTLRMGISVALAMNTMVLSFAMYFGLDEGPIYELARQLGFALATATMLVGGSFFVRSAWQSLRRGLLHLDLPIAIGVLLAFVGSTWSFFARSGAEYFDTLAVFVALMLVGRWLQERVVATNRARLLASDGVDGLWTRRVRDGVATLTRCVELRGGDVLLLAPGDLVPIDATLAEATSLRLDWINGESEPRPFEAGSVAPAGAFSAGRSAVRAVATADFARSSLVELLASPPSKAEGDAARFWDRLARVYVVGVLAAAAGAFALWMWLEGDAQRALGVTTAVLVVTCPCAFGIAVPLARDLVQASLRRTGLFVRSPSLLDRAPTVRRVVFDKTGTLTTGAPTLADPERLDALDEEARAALHAMASQSTHPKAAAVLAALPAGLTLDGDARVVEEPGAGLSAELRGRRYRLGRGEWAAPAAMPLEGSDLVFSRDGRLLVALRTHEAARPDAVAELAGLARAGLETWILSGDSAERVQALARALGVPAERAVGGQSPRDKAAWLTAHGPEHALFVGDGINDSLAADVALVTGTPAIDRPFMPARSDFYFVTPGLAPIRRLIEASLRLRRVVRVDLAIAVAYNVGAVALAYAGLVEPWVAAVLMPLSSLGTLAITTAMLGGRTPWRS